MKSYSILKASIFLVSLTASVKGVTVIGDILNIGTNSLYMAPNSRAGVIGYSNSLSAYSGMIVGDNNSLSGSGSMLVGYNNYNSATYVMAIGTSNQFPYNDDYGNATNSLSVGNNNVAWGSASLVAGSYNSLESRSDYYNPICSTLLGYGLRSAYDYCTVIGIYNSFTSGSELDSVTPLFVVGNGSYSNRSNAFEIWKDGRVKMVRQGDILMGEFGAP